MKYYLGPYQLDVGIAKDLGMRIAFVEPKGSIAAIDLRSDFERDETIGGCGIFVTPDDVELSSEYRCFGQGHISEIYPSERERRIFAGLIGMPWVAGDSLADWLWTALSMYSDPTGETGVKPLMPAGGKLNLWLGGLVRSKPFDLKMPEAQKCRDLMQIQYRRARNDTRDGRYPDELHHRRVLDYWGDKYRIDRPQDVFIPRGLPKETPVLHATTVSDDFNRADGDLHTGSWAVSSGAGALGIVSNAVQRTNNTGSLHYARHLTALSSDDQYVEVVVSKHDIVGAYAGAAVRFSAGNNCYLGWSRRTNGDGYEIWSLTGSGTTLTRIAHPAENPPASVPFTLRLEVDGTDIDLYDIGVSTTVPKATATAVEGNLYTGIAVSGQLVSGSQAITSFSGGDLSSTATEVTVSGPSSGVVSVQSTDFTFAPDGTPTGTLTVTPTSDKAGSWSVTPLSFTNTTPQTSKFTPTVTGVHAISSTDNGGLTNESINYTVSAAAATATTLSGPNSGTVGVASQNFTVGFNGTPPAGDTVITPTKSAGTGTFDPTTLTLNSGTPTGTFTFEKGEAGTVTIGITDDQGLTDATGISFTASDPGSNKFFRNTGMNGGFV